MASLKEETAMRGIYVLFFLFWNCGFVFAYSTQLPISITDRNSQCVDVNNMYWDGIDIYNHDTNGYYGSEGWYNNSLLSGRRQMTSFVNLPDHCIYRLKENWVEYLVSLKDEHPDIETIGEDIQTLVGCVVNDTNLECLFDVDILVKKCGNDLIYYLQYIEELSVDWGFYYCFEKIFDDPCAEPLGTPSIQQIDDDIYAVVPSDNKWYNYKIDGIQYVIGSAEDKLFTYYNTILKVFPSHYWMLTVNGAIDYWAYLDGNVKVLSSCGLSYYQYSWNYDNYCSYINWSEFYAIRCDDGIRYHSESFNWPVILLVNTKRAVVTPELHHKLVKSIIDGTQTEVYEPNLQFRCSFFMEQAEIYIVKWFIDDNFVASLGPTNDPDELMLKESEVNLQKLGFNITCSYKSATDEHETYSKSFFAGLEIIDSDIQLSRRGSALVRVKLTVPIGCLHSATEETTSCSQPLILYDPNRIEDECAGILSITSGNRNKCYEEIKTLKHGETWDPNIVYTFFVSTIEQTYDDKTEFNLAISVPNTVSHTIWQGYEQDGLKVTITENGTTSNNWQWNYYRYKTCYSRGDPHMKTGDGKYYEQQTEGDYMLYQNVEYQIEVQESTRYCFGNTRPVCECGVSVRAGQDVFMIDRCGSVNYLDFLHCGDGGILDVQVVNDYQYIVTTPTGTKIVIYAWGRFLSTTIILSAKDFENTQGLCGYFDNDSHRDFVLRNGSVTTESNSELFTETWRLSEEINLFTNHDRKLEKWSENNNSISCLCSSDGFCEQTYTSGCKKDTSITKAKCISHGYKRHRRSLNKRQDREINEHTIRKRSTDNVISNTTATQLCNDTVFNSPAVKYFIDLLAGNEDPNEVVKECAYDITVSQDVDFFLSMYVNTINDVVKNFLDLSPVYAANNTDIIEIFLLESCINNCSGNGECLITGQCLCQELFRGPGCSIDIRIPPIIQDIDEECDTANDNPCECFIVRTDNIFDGYMFSLNITQIHFDGQHKHVGDFIHNGIREDIFTGMVCIPATRTKRDVQHLSDYILSYDIALSNDGNNFGTAHTIIIYDSTCHEIIDNGTSINVNLEDDYCYIYGACVPDGYKVGCQLCNSSASPFKWTLEKCDDDDSGISTGVIIVIVVGCTLFILVIVTVLVCVMKAKSRKSRVQDIPIIDSVISLSDGQLPFYTKEKIKQVMDMPSHRQFRK